MGERAKVRRQLSGRIGVTFNPTPARIILNRPLLNLMSARSRDLDEADDPPAAEQPLSPSAEEPLLLTGEADGAAAVSKADSGAEHLPPNWHTGAPEDLPKCASDSEGRSAPPGDSVGRATASKSVQIDVIPGRLLLHPKLQARLEEEPDRFREGPIERRLSDTPPWLQAAAGQHHAHAASASSSEPDAAPQSKRNSAREHLGERASDANRHADAEPDAEARGRHAGSDTAKEGEAQSGTAVKTAEEKEADEENALAMRAHEKRAKSAMGGALALLPPREVWEKKIDFLLSVIGFAVDFANMYVSSVRPYMYTARGCDILLLLGSVHLSLIRRSNYIVRY